LYSTALLDTDVPADIFLADYTIMSQLVSRPVTLSKKPLSAFTADDFLTSTQWLNPPSSNADVLALQTRRSPSGEEWTEATHVHSSGLLITVRPVVYANNAQPAESVCGGMNRTPRLPPAYVIDEHKVEHKAVFYRMLSNPHRRELIKKAFSERMPSAWPASGFGDKEGLINGSSHEQEWRNGDGNVYAVGSWPCDSLTLLENCVRTGLKVAEKLGAKVPFKVVERTEF
jgi:hypothetical protein